MSKCGVADGLFRGMHLTVTVRIDRSGAAHTTIENAGNHPYVRCIAQQLQALKFEPSRDGGKRTRRYTI